MRCAPVKMPWWAGSYGCPGCILLPIYMVIYATTGRVAWRGLFCTPTAPPPVKPKLGLLGVGSWELPIEGPGLRVGE
jgi:hypothetical protein